MDITVTRLVVTTDIFKLWRHEFNTCASEHNYTSQDFRSRRLNTNSHVDVNGDVMKH